METSPVEASPVPITPSVPPAPSAKNPLKPFLMAIVGAALLGGIAFFVAPAPHATGWKEGETPEVAKNATFSFTFDQAMWHTRTEHALSFSPSLSGTFSWEGNTVTFHPANALEKSLGYKVTISRYARNWFGKAPTTEFSRSFTVRDDPEVSVVVPKDGVIVRPVQTVTVLFDRPMRVLTGSLDVPMFLKITPAIEGAYHWLGTSGFEFVPTKGWAPATTYVLTLPKGIVLTDGKSLPEDYTWHFSTPSVSVGFTSSTTDVQQKSAAQLNFNYPTNPAAVRDALTVYQHTVPGVDQPGTASEPKTVPVSQFNFANAKGDPMTVLITRRGGFELGSQYTFVLPEHFTGGVGPNGLDTSWTQSFTMDELGFRILAQFCPEPDAQKEVESSLIFRLNNTADENTLKKGVKITPPLKDIQVASYRWGCGDYGKGEIHPLSISGRWKASTTYTVTLTTALADLNGQHLAAPQTFTVTTKPYRARADLSGYNQSGVLASALPRVYQVRTLNMTEPITATVFSLSTQEYMNENKGAGTKVGEKSYPTRAALNAYHVSNIDLDAVAGKTLPNGFYRLDVRLPGAENYETSQFRDSRWLIVDDTSITTKHDKAGKLLVWATDMKTGEVTPNLTVDVYRKRYGFANTLIQTGKTDGQGIATFQTMDNDSDLVVHAHGGVHLGYGMPSWSDGINPWNFNLSAEYQNQLEHTIGYLYTDRLIYRPDQLVYFKGVLRKDVDGLLGIPDQKEVEVIFTDSNGVQVERKTVPVSTFGTFNGALQLNASMALGTYSFSVMISGDSIAGSFDVREYRRPDFKVTVDVPTGPVLAKDSIVLPIHAEYYYGAPLANATVEYTVTRRALAYQPMDTQEWFSYSDLDDAYCYWYCPQGNQFENVKNGTATLDANGMYKLTLPAALTDYKSSATYAITTTITDTNQRQVSANGELNVHKGDFYVGIRPDYNKGWSGPTADFDLATVNIDGSKHPFVTGTVQLYKRTWANVKKEGTGKEVIWEWQKSDALVTSSVFVTNDKAEGRVSFTPTEDGEYFAVAKTSDSRGRAISASVSRWVDRGYGAGVQVSDDHTMKIIQNHAEYKVGETASLIVQTPYEHTKALVSIERKTLREYRVIDLGTATRTVEIPITEDMTPNVYVSVLAVKGGGTIALPEFRLGYANLQVNTRNKVLDLSVTPDKTDYRPGDTVTVNVSSKNYEGAAVSAEVSLAVVDERVVSLLGSIDKNILGRFWFQRSIGVTTGQTLTQLVKKMFIDTEGGGGGKGDGGGASTVRGNFLDTALWKADVVTDPSGNATVSFKLPDNLTSWQILAIGETKDTVVGSAEATVVTRRDLMVEPILPRIIRHGDTMQVGATVANTTSVAINAKIDLTATGVQVIGAISQTVVVPANNRAPIYWKIAAPIDAVGQATFHVEAHGGGFADGFEVKIPLMDYSVPEMVSTSNSFGHAATEQIKIPTGILPDRGELKVSVASTVGTGLKSSITYLVDYVYGCVEQTTSALVGSLMYDQLVKTKLAPDTDALQTRAQARIAESIKRLVSTQRTSGGWGFWPESDYDYPYLTAYAFWGLTQAEKAGYTVDPHVLDRADTYLRNYLASPEGDYWVNQRAEILFMLADRKPENLSGYAASVYEKRTALNAGGKAFLAMALQSIDQSSSMRTLAVLNDLKSSVVYPDPSTAYITEDTGYTDAFLNSNVRSSSLYLQALLRISPQNEEIERVVRYLMRQKTEGYWFTTHDTAMVLESLIAYVNRHPIDTTPLSVNVAIDHASSTTLAFDQGDLSGERSTTIPLADLAAKGADHTIDITKDSDTRYFYDVSMKVYREIENIQPFENGFTLLGDVYALSDTKRLHPLTQAKQGDTVRVHLKLLASKDHQAVALEYHLPAGLEPIDFSLKTSPQNIAGQTEQCAPGWGGEQICMSDWEYGWWWENVWKHIEFRDDRVFLFADTLGAGIYEYDFIAQAVTPGDYRVPPARVYEFYNPLMNAHNEGKKFRVLTK